jgi:hypothetical protein
VNKVYQEMFGFNAKLPTPSEEFTWLKVHWSFHNSYCLANVYSVIPYLHAAVCTLLGG